MSCSASSIPTSTTRSSVKMPCTSSPKRLSRFSEARLAVSRVGPAYWSDEISSMPGYSALHLLEEALLALLGARRALLVAQQEHLALAAEQLAHVARAASSPPLQVVGGDEADDLVRLEARVDDDGRARRARRASSTAARARASSSGASTMPLDALAREALDDLDLLLAVVLAQRALPDRCRPRCPRV